MLRRSKHCPWDDSGSPEGADGDSGDLEEDVTAPDRTLHVLTVDATPLGGTITAGVVSQMGSPFAEDTPRCIVSAAAAAAVEDADGNNIEWKPLKEVFSDEDWASAERLGFPLSVDPELRAAEQEAMPLLQATALRCEKHWHSYSRGLPLLSNATVEATEFMRQSLWRYGAPCHLRGVIWLTLSGVAMRMDENQGFCRALLERHRYMRGEHADAIEKDLRRTFPGHPYFAQGGVGMRKARNVLHALCWRNPLLNYCQSFNYLVAFILLVLDDEESTFWLMCHLLENLLPNDLYSESLIGTRVDQLVLQELVQERLPRLALHFSKVRFEAGTLVSAWVMVLFVTVFPVETVLRVWDCLFAGCAQPGSPSCVLLEVVLAVLKLRQHDLLQCDDAGDVVMCLNHSVRRLFDAEELMQVVVEMRLTPLTVQRLRRRLRPIVAEEHRQREQRRQAVQKRYLLRQQGATVETPRQHMGENEEGRKEVKESGRIRRVSAAVAAVDAQEQQQQQQQPQLQQLAVPHSRVTHPHRCERPREPRQREYRDVFAGMGFADGARHRLQCGGQEPHHGHVGDARNCDGNMRRRTGEESCGREMESISAEVENREKRIRRRRQNQMARGRRPAVAPAKRVTKKVPVDTSSSIAEALRQASADGDDDGVVLVCRKVAGRRGRTAADKPGSLFQRQDCRLHLQPTAPDVSFWKGVCRHTTLVQALANIGTLVEAEPTLLFASPHPRYPFSALSVDRLRTAIQAVVDANFILQSTYGGDSKPVSPSDSLHKKWEIVRKLVQLSEAAVPMKTSVLKYAAMTSNGNMSTSNSAEVLVPPTTPWALQDRLQRLKRLWQLRECQVHIISELRLCKTKRDVAVALLGPSMDASNTVEPLPGMSSWHQREQSLIKGLVDQVNDDSPCSESWGAPFAPALRVSGGSYVLQRRFRSEALVSLLEAAEFFGLPPFLRSIRVSGGRARPFSLQAAPTVTPMEVGGTAHSVEEPLPYFFPLPCDLDPRCYEVPPPGQAKLVQEELIDLACRHCRFGALVGEADQVLALLHASAAYRQRVKAEQVALKSELAESDRAPGVGAGPGEDPLLAYAQLLATAAQEGSKKEGEVHWLCGNHWSSTMSYYALVLAAVPPHTRGEEAEEQEDIDGDECAARRSDDATTLYYVAAVLELTRS